jgi:tetratricopeptide (TPR) repeat protein
MSTLEGALEIAATLDGAEAHVPALCEAASDIAQNQGDFDRAEALLQRAIETESRLTGPGSLATVSLMRNLACMLNNRGRTRAALALFAQARQQVAAWSPSAERDLMDHLLSMLEGRSWQTFGFPGRALACFDDALRTMAREGDAQAAQTFNPRSAVILHQGRGVACLELGRLHEAGAAAAEADRLAQVHGVHGPDLMFGAAQLRVRLALAQGETQAAIDALQVYEDLQPPALTAPWRLRLQAEIAEARGEPAAARTHLDAALAHLREPSPTFMAGQLELQLRLQRGRLALADAQPDLAVAEFERAWELARQLQDGEQSLGAGRAVLALAEALAARGTGDDRVNANALLQRADTALALHEGAVESHAVRLQALRQALN